jgi:hypothetical protein
VAAFAIVERVNAVEQVGFCFFYRVVTSAMHPFILQAVKEALNNSRSAVIPAKGMRG